MSVTQKILLGVTILASVGLVLALLASKRLVPEPRRKEGLLLEMLSNVSTDLDRLDAGFEGMSTQMDLARNRLGRLIALHRENLLVCAMLRERRRKSISKRKPRVGENEESEEQRPNSL